MKRADSNESSAGGSPRLLLDILDGLVGPAIVLDAKLTVAFATPSAPALVGTEVPIGVHAAALLCGDAEHRPMAEALAAGRSGVVTIQRPGPDGALRPVVVRATPMMSEGSQGWLLTLGLDPLAPGPDAAVRFHGLWTRDPAMQQVFHVLGRAARREATVLVRGETGTGKELVGRAVHALSARASGPFAAINCAALPANLLESELFGHVRGAFTGAVHDHPGFFQTAHGGTLFLDEVAEMPLELQAKLLRVLETKTVLPVGGREPVRVDVRVVAATHQSLRRAVDAGRFRSDLMYRLRVIPVFLPPLRERVGDVALLTDRFIEAMNEEEGRRVTHVSAEAREVLERYPFPGNVRELQNALEYAYVIGEGPVLRSSDLPLEIVHPEGIADRPPAPEVNAPAPAPVGEAPEVTRIRRALERAGGNRERAAQVLGVSRVTLWRRMRALGLE